MLQKSTITFCWTLYYILQFNNKMNLGKVDATTSPIKHKEKLTTSQSSLVKSGTINIDSCKVDDVVLVVWDQQRENYTIFQQSAYLYFLHTECIEPLGLKPTGNEPRKMYCIAKVTQKEFCHARKVSLVLCL